MSPRAWRTWNEHRRLVDGLSRRVLRCRRSSSNTTHRSHVATQVAQVNARPESGGRTREGRGDEDGQGDDDHAVLVSDSRPGEAAEQQQEPLRDLPSAVSYARGGRPLRTVVSAMESGATMQTVSIIGRWYVDARRQATSAQTAPEVATSASGFAADRCSGIAARDDSKMAWRGTRDHRSSGDPLSGHVRPAHHHVAVLEASDVSVGRGDVPSRHLDVLTHVKGLPRLVLVRRAATCVAETAPRITRWRPNERNGPSGVLFRCPGFDLRKGEGCRAVDVRAVCVANVCGPLHGVIVRLATRVCRALRPANFDPSLRCPTASRVPQVSHQHEPTVVGSVQSSLLRRCDDPVDLFSRVSIRVDRDFSVASFHLVQDQIQPGHARVGRPCRQLLDAGLWRVFHARGWAGEAVALPTRVAWDSLPQGRIRAACPISREGVWAADAQDLLQRGGKPMRVEVIGRLHLAGP